jgi:hypothetical protein
MLMQHIALYFTADCLLFDPPLAFCCMAEDYDHAEEQALNANPGADIVWIVQAANTDAAYHDYWHCWMIPE